MRNGTIRRTPQGLSWAWTLLLALFVALFTVGCGVTGEQSDADVTVVEESESQEASEETDGAEVEAEAQAEARIEAESATQTEAQTETDTNATALEEPEAEDAYVQTDGVETEVERAEDLTRSRPKGSYTAELNLPESGTYTSKDEVAWYLHTYGHLPSNFVTKKTAERAGWKTQGLTIDEACPGKSIGGDRFGNYEGLLPDARGRKWYECDIDYHGGKSRGAKRIVYSSDGLIYYTGDHYSSFDRIY